MTSRFATGITQRNSPAYCKKGMRDGVPYWTAGLPVAINAYARWLDLVASPEVDISESFYLHRRPAANGWDGGYTDEGRNVYLQVDDASGLDNYNVTIWIRLDQAPYDSDFWNDVHIPNQPPWTSGLLQHIITPGQVIREVRLLA